MISPLVSIVVTAYQSDPQELGEAIESARGQSFTDIEIIISDDSASDRVHDARPQASS